MMMLRRVDRRNRRGSSGLSDEMDGWMDGEDGDDDDHHHQVKVRPRLIFLGRGAFGRQVSIV
jgi:hypothetical protein